MLSYSIAETIFERTVISRSSYKVNEVNTSPTSLDERFDNLLISAARVSQMLGKRSPGEVTFEESEQGDARRRLLHVEKVAIKNKQLQAENEASYMDRVSGSLHQRLFDAIQQQIVNPDALITQVLNLDGEIVPLLDNLSVKATSITRIEPHAAALPWLYDDLMTVVNAPKFRRKDARGKIIPVETLRTALSFLGIDNLRLLIPTMIFRRALPKITDPFPDIKNKVMQYAQGTAITMRALAADYKLQGHEAFATGLFSQLGRCAIVRLYFKLFEQIQIEMLKEAEADRDTDLHSALGKLQPSANYLIAIQNACADTLTAQLLEVLHFRRLRIALPMIEMQDSADEPHALTTLLVSARAYTTVRMLHQGKFIEKDEIPVALAKTGLSRPQRDLLKMLDIFQLPLTENKKND